MSEPFFTPKKNNPKFKVKFQGSFSLAEGAGVEKLITEIMRKKNNDTGKCTVKSGKLLKV